MFILHLCFDGNFVTQSYKTFDKYYPDKNLFLVNRETEDFRVIKDKEHFHGIPFTKHNFERINRMCDDCGVDTILLHGLSRTYIGLLEYLFSSKTYKVYWIFWGYELYVSLAQLGRYQLVDKKVSPFSPRTYMYPNKYNLWLCKLLRKQVISEVLMKAIPYIDYFCFWNYGDYKLLQDNFHTGIKYKFFVYSSLEKDADDLLVQTTLPTKQHHTLLINHQASVTGNHHTIMERIATVDKDNLYEKIIPLSYGSGYIRKAVLKKGKALFGEKFSPVLRYMPQAEYFALINKVEVAVIGARRQEAAGNIINLLSNGTKVFLREDNNLLQYYREKGFIIFSYEKDLNSLADLQPLTMEEQLHNRECRIKSRVYNEQFMPSFIDQ